MISVSNTASDRREDSGPALCARGSARDIVADLLRQATGAIADHERAIECGASGDSERPFAEMRVRLALNEIATMARCLGLMDLEGSYDPRTEREALDLIMRGSGVQRVAPPIDESDVA
jgi:hypothetical protein